MLEPSLEEAIRTGLVTDKMMIYEPAVPAVERLGLPRSEVLAVVDGHNEQTLCGSGSRTPSGAAQSSESDFLVEQPPFVL